MDHATAPTQHQPGTRFYPADYYIQGTDAPISYAPESDGKTFEFRLGLITDESSFNELMAFIEHTHTPREERPDEPYLVHRFSLDEVITNMVTSCECGPNEDGTLSIQRKSDFDSLRAELTAAIAKIEALKFE